MSHKTGHACMLRPIDLTHGTKAMPKRMLQYSVLSSPLWAHPQCGTSTAVGIVVGGVFDHGPLWCVNTEVHGVTYMQLLKVGPLSLFRTVVSLPSLSSRYNGSTSAKTKVLD